MLQMSAEHIICMIPVLFQKYVLSHNISLFHEYYSMVKKHGNTVDTRQDLLPVLIYMQESALEG